MANGVNLVVKQSITEALLILMQKQPFEKISISEITRLAGVGRVSFYRNYQSKEDILHKYLRSQFDQHFAAVASARKLRNVRDIFVNIFAFLKNCEWMLSVIYDQQFSHLLLDFIKDCCGAKAEHEDELAYKNALIMGVVFGAVDEWIRRGCVQSPDDMADNVATHLGSILDGWHKYQE
ncbi:hypothetical protein A1D22_04835 [Pasteurellaceae bacterium LFhippo2]|nr:hypothetical protein [Pasteurellaceae bacterium LFhippo2]